MRRKLRSRCFFHTRWAWPALIYNINVRIYITVAIARRSLKVSLKFLCRANLKMEFADSPYYYGIYVRTTRYEVFAIYCYMRKARENLCFSCILHSTQSGLYRKLHSFSFSPKSACSTLRASQISIYKALEIKIFIKRLKNDNDEARRAVVEIKKKKTRRAKRRKIPLYHSNMSSENSL